MNAGLRCQFGFDSVVPPHSCQRKSASSALRLLLACALPFAAGTSLPAQDATTQQDVPAGPPAVLELVLPPGAVATADGKPVDDPRAVTIADLKPDEYRRVKLAVKFADGTEAERVVDIKAGLQLRLSVPRPRLEKAAVVVMQST